MHFSGISPNYHPTIRVESIWRTGVVGTRLLVDVQPRLSGLLEVSKLALAGSDMNHSSVDSRHVSVRAARRMNGE
jgi:hypothetical protein